MILTEYQSISATNQGGTDLLFRITFWKRKIKIKKDIKIMPIKINEIINPKYNKYVCQASMT